MATNNRPLPFFLFFFSFFLRKLFSSYLDSIDICIHVGVPFVHHRITIRYFKHLCRASSNPPSSSVFTLYTAKHMRLGSIRHPITHASYGLYSLRTALIPRARISCRHSLHHYGRVSHRNTRITYGTHTVTDAHIHIYTCKTAFRLRCCDHKSKHLMSRTV